MNEFEQKLNSILSDPQELEKISRLAAQIMGGGETAEPPPGAGGTPDFKSILSGLGKQSDKTALLQALSPYLSAQRQARLQKALRLAEAARIAGIAIDACGGECALYNRYQGNTGRVERIDTPEAPPESRVQRPPLPGAGEQRPPGSLSGLSGELGRLLHRLTRMNLETEDVLLLMILYLLYRESGDEDFLFMLAGVLLF